MPCKLCGADQFRPWLVGVPQLGSRTPSRFAIERCGGCGLLQTRPEPLPAELQEAYGPAYTWKNSTSFLGRLESLYRQLLVRYDQARAVQCAARLAEGNKLLDVGCADGLVVAEARRVGLVAHGIDRPDVPLWPGCDPAWRGAGDIETLDQPPESWDVVSLFHVLEHLREPLTLLAKVHAWLRPRGVLVVQVPNASSFQARLFRARWNSLDIPRHLTHWTEATLTRALRETGYEVAVIRRVSWRDNGYAFASSVLPAFDARVERERSMARAATRGVSALALRRLVLVFLLLAWTPLTLVEALAHASASITVFAQKHSR
jgi:SAM-dependent methyltransferase